MNRVLKVVSVAMLSTVLAVSTAVAVSAADSDINDAEQSVLDELNTTVNLNGTDTPIPSQYVNQAENYFRTIDMSDDEAAEIIEKIQEIKAYLEETGVSKFSELDADQIDELVGLANDASEISGVSLAYNKSNQVVTAYDEDGNPISDIPVDDGDDENGDDENGDDETGDDETGDDETGDDETGKGGNGGNGGSSKGGNNGVIKTTGFDVPSVTAVAGLGIVLVSAAGVYLLRTSKKSED